MHLQFAQKTSTAFRKVTPTPWSRRLASLAAIALIFLSPECRAGGLAFDAAGNLYLSSGHSVLKFAPDGAKSIFATGLMSASGLAFDHKGNLYVSDGGSTVIYCISKDGLKNAFLTCAGSFGMAFDVTDNLYLTQGASIVKFAPNGAMSTFTAHLGEARDIAIDAAGHIYVLEKSPSTGVTIHKFGPGGEDYSFVSFIPMEKPGGLAVDAAGNVYAVELRARDGSPAILKFDPDQQRSTFVEEADAISMGSVAVDKAGNAFVFNGAAMGNSSFRKYDENGAQPIALSPDKQWLYRLAGGNFPEIARAGQKDVAVDLTALEAPHPTNDAVVWAPDSKSFAFNYSPPHASHTSYETVAVYQWRGEKWAETHSLADNDSDLSQLAQVGKGRLPKKILREHPGERDILKLSRWLDNDTALFYCYSHQAKAKSGGSEESYVFTAKLDANGKWKIVEMHAASAKERDAQ